MNGDREYGKKKQKEIKWNNYLCRIYIEHFIGIFANDNIEDSLESLPFLWNSKRNDTIFLLYFMFYTAQYTLLVVQLHLLCSGWRYFKGKVFVSDRCFRLRGYCLSAEQSLWNKTNISNVSGWVFKYILYLCFVLWSRSKSK